MKRIIPTLFILFLINISLVAQAAIIADPAINEETFSVDLESFNDLVIHSSMVNTSDATLDVKWVRVVGELPEGWTSKVCDNTTCYADFVYSNVASEFNLDAPITLTAGEAGTLDVHINPNGVAGTGLVTVELYDNSNMNEVVSTGTFTFHIEDINVSISEIEKAALQLYPNPSPDYFQLTNANIVDNIVVYNIVGRAVKTFDVYDGERYDVADLPNGMYLVSLVSEEEGVVKTVRLSKRSYRP